MAMNAALPFMDGEMRDFAARTIAKVVHMTEAEFAGLALYPASMEKRRSVSFVVAICVK